MALKAVLNLLKNDGYQNNDTTALAITKVFEMHAAKKYNA
jgi:hypothetical protein